VLATLKELQLATLNVLLFVYTCSDHVSALVIVLSDSPCESTGKWETVGMHLAGTSVIKTVTLLGVLRVTVSKVMSAYTSLGRHRQRRGTVGENQHCQKNVIIH
jgi:hypothetical protein